MQRAKPYSQRDIARAGGIFSSVLRSNPDCAAAHFGKAMVLASQGRLNDALESIERALAIKPAEPDYIVAKAQTLGRLQWRSQAIEWYRRAIKLRPMPELSFELAASLIDEGRADEALVVLRPVVTQVPAERQPHELLAQAYTESLRIITSAAAHWRSAERLTTDANVLIHLRVNSEIYAGRLKVAEDLLREALDRDPSAAELYQPFTSIRKVNSGDAEVIENMERLLSDSTLKQTTIRNLRYALGKAYSDLGEYGRAMKSYDQANRIAYELSPTSKQFNAIDWRAYTDFQIEFFTKDRVRSLATEGLTTSAPCFILGMIRSGTTLVEQILSPHSEIEAGGETTFWPDHRNEILDVKSRTFHTPAAMRLGQEFVNTIKASKSGSQYFTEKNPSNVVIAALIHCVFPNAKFVHIKRQAVDNLLSIWMTPLNTGLPFVYDKDNLVSAYRDYLRLSNHLIEGLPQDRFQTFDYEKITSNPKDGISSILGFLGLDPEPECFHPEGNSRTVRTPSYYQVRQPINTNSQAKWKLYEPWLGSFAELLDTSS